MCNTRPYCETLSIPDRHLANYWTRAASPSDWPIGSGCRTRDSQWQLRVPPRVCVKPVNQWSCSNAVAAGMTSIVEGGQGWKEERPGRQGKRGRRSPLPARVLQGFATPRTTRSSLSPLSGITNRYRSPLSPRRPSRALCDPSPSATMRFLNLVLTGALGYAYSFSLHLHEWFAFALSATACWTRCFLPTTTIVQYWANTR